MLAHLREFARSALPSRVVHAYRLARHTMFWPNEPEMRAVRQFLSSDRNAVDVGANFGLFTSVLARHSKRVIAFEPNSDCARYLAQVLPRNCDVIAKAASDSSGKATLRVPVSDGTVVMSALATIETANHFDSESRATGVVNHSVETTTLDQVLMHSRYASERLGFINIDAEGHEFSVLRGGEGLLAGHRPVLLVELEYRHGAPVAEVFDWLVARQYAPRALLDGQNLAPLDASDVRALQTEERLARRLAGKPDSGYVNNIFFVPATAPA